MIEQVPDSLLVFENLFNACENGLLSKDAFYEASEIYKELIAVRAKLNEAEAGFPASQ
jgi:hypothetical protein